MLVSAARACRGAAGAALSPSRRRSSESRDDLPVEALDEVAAALWRPSRRSRPPCARRRAPRTRGSSPTICSGSPVSMKNGDVVPAERDPGRGPRRSAPAGRPAAAAARMIGTRGRTDDGPTPTSDSRCRAGPARFRARSSRPPNQTGSSSPWGGSGPKRTSSKWWKRPWNSPCSPRHS